MLSVVFSNTYRLIKIGAATTCILIGASILIYTLSVAGWTQGIGVAYIVASSVMILTGILLALDSTKFLAELRAEVTSLHNINDSLHDTIDEYKAEVNDLNVTCENIAKKFNETASKLSKSNADYAALITQSDEQIGKLKTTSDNLEKTLRDRTKAFGESIDKLEEQLKSQCLYNQQAELRIKDLEVQISSAQQLNKNMRVIIQSLAQTLDQSNSLAQTLDFAVVKIQASSDDIIKNAEIMQTLTTGLKKLKFTELDLNSDGAITLAEFDAALKLHK